MSTDAYLRRKYGIDRKVKRRMANEQNNACKICKRTHTQATKRKPSHPILFHVDHDHAIEKAKITVLKLASGVWHAEVSPYPGLPRLYIFSTAKLKREAVNFIRQYLKRASVRGLLCWHCNALLAKGRDNPEVFENAALYLRESEARYQ